MNSEAQKNSHITNVRDLIVGAGLAGLTLARALKSDSFTVLEKSKAIGGRMATRRVDDYTFDHGAQFYQADLLKDLDIAWTDAKLSVTWQNLEGMQLKAGLGGMTSLAKMLAAALPHPVLREKLVERIERHDHGWHVTTDQGEVFRCERVFLSCPLPQSLKILASSGLACPPELQAITYDKALVGLFGLSRETTLPPELDLQHLPTPEIRMIANQQSKAVSRHPALTVVMGAAWSDLKFDQDENPVRDEIQDLVSKYFKAQGLDLEIQNASLKKWRYAFPNKKAATPFSEVQPGLFLFGDAFGGESLAGAFQSAQALSDFCLKAL